MVEAKYSRVGWLVRRLSRITPAEVPYRVLGVLRGAAQGRGWFDAARPPRQAAAPAYGQAWVASPAALDQAAVLEQAERLLRDGVPVFDILVPLAPGTPDWNRDPKTGHDIGQGFGLDIDFRHVGHGVDIKYLWELNRHLWWVPLAQAYQVSGERRYLDWIGRLLESWLDACPYARGPNWSSPVEHGIRLINWSVVWHLIGGRASALFDGAAGERLLARWMDSIYQHMRFASDNYSFHSSSDNHLIGEAAGLYVAGHTWDLWEAARPMRRRAQRIMEQEMLKQFAADGVNLEQALCYHKFSLEFMLAAVLCGQGAGDRFSDAFMARMEQAMLFLAAMMDSRGQVPAFGDADDGKVFALDADADPYLAMLQAGAQLFGTPSLRHKLALLNATPAPGSGWLVTRKAAAPSGASAQALPTVFAEGGYVLLGRDLHQANELRALVDVGALGYNRIAGHGHADSLAVLFSAEGREFLVDPGTYCYNAAPALRHYFRGTSAHNTVQIDGDDQSVYGGSFLWLRDIVTTLHAQRDDGASATLEASHDGYMRLADPLRHRRRVTLERASATLVVEDRFECAGAHRGAWHWHFAPECVLSERDGVWYAERDGAMLRIELAAAGYALRLVSGQEQPPLGWNSDRFYHRKPSPVLVCEGPADAAANVVTRFTYLPAPAAAHS